MISTDTLELIARSAVQVLLQGLSGGCTLWLGARFTGIQLGRLPAFLIALLTSLVSLIPLSEPVTALLGGVFMLLLLYKWSSIENIWSEGVLLAAVARIIQTLLKMTLALSFR